ncbi:DDHD-domain-containing protein [Thozetella sp. PMI_491]|nr:DDHD-domain-containing protein [Thozetella sp. PMI_491]
MAPGTSDKKVEKSYLSSAVDSINPWSGSRSSTPVAKEPAPRSPASVNPGDHSSNPFYGQSLKKYPADCPPLVVQWFHAVDVPKRKPKFLKSKNDDDKKPQAQPKKYVAFSPGDSRALEAAYQTKLEAIEEERDAAPVPRTGSVRAGSKRPRVVSVDDPQQTTDAEEMWERPGGTRVPVNEDFLFEVGIEERELSPVYWLGPTYDVRRGAWFYQEGSTLRPCEDNLAAQLEEGYLKIKPWMYPRLRSNSGSQGPSQKPSSENLTETATAQVDGTAKPNAPAAPPHRPQVYRLFGAYMNNVATYQDANTAWLSSDGVLSWVTSTVYETFAGGGYMGGVKLVRGYSEPNKSKDEKRPSTPTGTKSTLTEKDEKQQKMLKRRSAPASTRLDSVDIAIKTEEPGDFESRQNRLTRQLSNLIEGSENPDQVDEAIRKREEQDIVDDYNARLGETQGRDIEHLVLVTHGIGQLLGLRMESINFVHDVNVLRKTMKTVYSSSADLRALNSEINDKGPGNCRVQVLPVLWRHLLDFPKRKQKKGEHDLGETFNEEDEYPSLEDITIEGVAFARSLISDLALDVLLYQSGYREQISDIVLKESNRIYRLFKERNPEFKGKIHIIGHSLGSAIMFDILCRQKENTKGAEQPKNPLRFWPSQDRYESRIPKDLEFDFDVEDFYALGSPIGLFQMLKGRTISARHLPNSMPSESPLNPDYYDDPFLHTTIASSHSDQRISPVTGLPYTISSPKVKQLFNVFHPSDPISYRLEPLIAQVMSSMKPQTLPYTKRGIFGSVAPQGLTGIGAKVGQSVSGFWSSLSSGIASSLLNRSLGLSQEDVANITQSQHRTSPGAGTNISAGVIANDANLSDAQRSERTAERQRQLADGAMGRLTASGNEATLLDDELETLFSRFQKKRLDLAKEKGNESLEAKKWVEEEEKAQKLKREELKVRALNRNGRVDYSIQESVLDFNPITTIASHMSYWGDEDVNHFVLSQLLSSKPRDFKDR